MADKPFRIPDAPASRGYKTRPPAYSLETKAGACHVVAITRDVEKGRWVYRMKCTHCGEEYDWLTHQLKLAVRRKSKWCRKCIPSSAHRGLPPALKIDSELYEAFERQHRGKVHRS